MEYPKISSLYKREGCGPFDEKKKRYVCDLEKKPRKSALIEGEFACPEFAAINQWTITEKVDGTNVRIIFESNRIDKRLRIAGRSDNACFPNFLMDILQGMICWDDMKRVFQQEQFVVLYGEGYGHKIQSGGYYRDDVSFILFDVYVDGWWLLPNDVEDVAHKLKIQHVPPFITDDMFWTTNEIVEFVKCRPPSLVAEVEEHEMEGIVAKSYPVMNFRKGGQIMFKLKCKDFEP